MCCVRRTDEGSRRINLVFTVRDPSLEVKLNFDTLISEKGTDKGIGRLRERGVITGKDLGRKTFISLLSEISFENFIYFVRKSLT